MTVRECVEKNGWGVDVESNVGKFWSVDIGFINNVDDCYDETEFSISAYDIDELEELFGDFCKENRFAPNTVTYVSVVEMADNEEDLS